jgi:sterol desaturase/sphingolipid hydroxylase (fatty acid hydroxylase superfamily)
MTEHAAFRQPPIRLFRSDFLEFFSHISPVTVAILWTPVVAYFIGAAALRLGRDGWFIVPAGVFLGWFVWTFVEYTMHRFIFHYHPKTERLKRVFFVMHGVHHAQPMCKTRLVMPPAISVPVALVFYGLFQLITVRLIGAPQWFYPVFGGFIGGYLIYDMMHYSIHHSSVRSGIFFAIRVHHLRHHGACSFMRFGVTFSLWDHVFGTIPKGTCAELLQEMQSTEAGN